MRFWIVAFLTGCGLYDGGSSTTPTDDGSAPDSVVTTDGGKPVEAGPPLPCSTDGGPCVASLPAGWSPIVVDPSATLGCPSNFMMADAITNPMLLPGACTCPCNIATQPSCSIGMESPKYGDNQCGMNWKTLNITTDGQCMDLNMGSFTPAPYQIWPKLPLTNGTCTAGPATIDMSKATGTAIRQCIAPSACAEDVCNGTAPTGFQACVVHDDDVACPPSTPFKTKLPLAGATNISCDMCSPCSVTATCGNATVNIYTDQNCMNFGTTIAADNGCHSTNGSKQQTFKYVGSVQNPTCVPGMSTASVDLAMKKTICCR
jgi:hypothetical protein